jgi:hypothetical protein
MRELSWKGKMELSGKVSKSSRRSSADLTFWGATTHSLGHFSRNLRIAPESVAERPYPARESVNIIISIIREIYG